MTTLTARMATCGTLFFIIYYTRIMGGRYTSFFMRSRPAGLPPSATAISRFRSFWLSAASGGRSFIIDLD